MRRDPWEKKMAWGVAYLVDEAGGCKWLKGSRKRTTRCLPELGGDVEARSDVYSEPRAKSAL